MSSEHRLATGEQERDGPHSGEGSNVDSGRGHSCTENADRGQHGQRASRLAPPPPPRLAAYNTMPQVLPAHSDAAKHILKTFSASPDSGYLHKYFQSFRSSPPDAVKSNSTPSSPECCPQHNRPPIVWTSNCNGLVV